MKNNKYPIGYEFNNLTVIEYLGQIKKCDNHSYYKCQCSCGKTTNIALQFSD